MRPQERATHLKRIDILASLSEAALAHLAQSCKWRDYGPGEQILGYADSSTDVLFLLTGKARVTIYSADGKAVVFVDLIPATMFGEIAAIDHKPRSATVEALEIKYAGLSVGRAIRELVAARTKRRDGDPTPRQRRGSATF